MTTCTEVNPAHAMGGRSKNTLTLSQIWVSEPVLRDPANQAKRESLTPVQAMVCDAHETLVDPT
ncbi:MAG: hypothetical protein NTW68_10880 [candidate division NC10 bacterium]|nr:hypothetical protein [candidate division NC10 bacterium]